MVTNKIRRSYIMFLDLTALRPPSSQTPTHVCTMWSYRIVTTAVFAKIWESRGSCSRCVEQDPSVLPLWPISDSQLDD